MTSQLFIASIIGLVLVAYAVIAWRTWIRYQGRRIVLCPVTRQPVAVKVDVAHAVMSAVWQSVDVRLTSCTQWPERGACSQPCVKQLGADCETRPKALARTFFAGKRCALCQRRIKAPTGVTLQPGFMHPVTHKVDTWDDVPIQTLPEAFTSWRPLCMNCTLAESSRQKFPDRITDRPAHG